MPAFRWPVRGRVIAGFGAKSNGTPNDGINLAVPEGTPSRLPMMVWLLTPVTSSRDTAILC